MIRSTASRTRRAALQRRWLSTAPEHGKAHARSAGLASASRRVSDVKSEKLADAATNVTYTLPHPIYSDQYVDGVELTHKEPEKFVDTLAMRTIQLMRFNFDWISGYSWMKLTEGLVLRRVLFLESVAGVPGSVAATLRHLKSLRTMERDGAWIHSLLQEAENERMHLLTAIKMHRPGPLFRAAVFISQGVFFNFFFAAYLVNSRFCHSMVGYLEEEAVLTYTHILSEIEKGHIFNDPHWKVPKIAQAYWNLPPDATVFELFQCIRADEAHHRDANHVFARLPPGAHNPMPISAEGYAKHLKQASDASEVAERQSAKAAERARM